MEEIYKVVVIGAGPAGCMAALETSKNNKVILIEKNNHILKKLSITGGGRCNITNNKNIREFLNNISVNSKLLYSSISNFGPKEIENFFYKNNVLLVEEEDNKLFPKSNSSMEIINCFENVINKNNILVKLNEKVEKIEVENDLKVIKTNKNIYKCLNLVIATGGKSYSNTGSTGDGYLFSKSLNQPITDLYPALTFLKTRKHDLAGISIDNVKISLNNIEKEGSLLFTHIGISGPAIFKISEYVYKELLNNEVKIKIDFCPLIKYDELLNNLNNYDYKKETISFLKEYLPKRLALHISSEIGNVKIAELSKIRKKLIIDYIKKYEIEILETGKIEQSIVTGGGIDMKYIDTRTMESKINRGVYYAGEVLDTHGITGGYNITIALSTGCLVGKSINEKNE